MPWVGLTWTSLAFSAYLMGSIPTAYLVTRWLTGRDIRRLGDGNAGAANVSRTVGPRAGITVGVVDITKGAAAILLARGLFHSAAAEMMAGAAVIAGHNWPVHLGLRGGRGAATASGVLVVLLPLPAVPLGIFALLILYWTKSTIKAMSVFLIPIGFLAWLLGYSYSLMAYAVGMPVMVGLSHYFSLKRLSPTSSQPSAVSTPPLPRTGPGLKADG